MFGREAMIILKELGRKIEEECREERVFPYLLQRISVAICRDNTAAVLGSTGPYTMAILQR